MRCTERRAQCRDRTKSHCGCDLSMTNVGEDNRPRLETLEESLMQHASFAEIEPEFIERAHRMVWCDMATVCRDGWPRTTRHSTPLWRAGSAYCAHPSSKCCACGREPSIHPRDHGLPARAQAPHHYQGGGARARAPARPYGLHRGQALRSRRQARGRAAHRRPFHLDCVYPIDALHPLLARQGRCRAQARGLRTRRAIPARPSSMCWRPIRATSSFRSTRTRFISSHWLCWRSMSGRGFAGLPAA